MKLSRAALVAERDGPEPEAEPRVLTGRPA